MVTISEAGDDIYQISTLVKGIPEPVVAYFVLGKPSALVETGPTTAAKAIIEEAMPQLPGGLASLLYIIPTHIHVDHGGGAGYLAERFPQVKVVVHPRGAPHLIHPAQLIDSTRLSFGENFEQTLGTVLAIPPARLHLAQDGEEFSLGTRRLRVIYTPGHAPHHISLFDSKSGGVFCGEALGLHPPGLELIIPSASRPRFDLEAALASMERLEKLSPRKLFYSHNGVLDEVSKFISLARESAVAYGEKVWEAMEGGESLEALAWEMQAEAQRRGIGWRAEDFAQLIEGYRAHFQEKVKERQSFRRSK